MLLDVGVAEVLLGGGIGEAFDVSGLEISQRTILGIEKPGPYWEMPRHCRELTMSVLSLLGCAREQRTVNWRLLRLEDRHIGVEREEGW